MASAPSTIANFPQKGGSKALIRLDRQEGKGGSAIYVLHMLGAETPDNRLTFDLLDAWIEVLDYVERAWNDADQEVQRKGAALVTTSQVEPTSKFYSNGLDFEKAIADPNFFDRYLNRVYEKLMTFPMATVASIGGHAFAGGFALTMAHDYRVFNGKRGYLSMNEIDFGAQIPPGLYAALASKQLPMNVMRKMVLEGHRFGAAEALAERIVDVVAPAADDGNVTNGPATTLKASIDLAERLAPKAAKDCYGSNKLVMYAPFLAILREKNEVVTGRL